MANVVRNMVNILGISDFIPNSSEIYKEFSVNDTVILSCQKPDIERLISSAFDAQIISVRVINTPAGEIPAKGIVPSAVTSSEGEMLTGKKLVVEIKFRQKIQYVANEPQQSVHGVHNEFIVSEFIVIPQTFEVGGECVTPEYLLANNMFLITPFIEDANISMMDMRTICSNVLVLLQVNTKKCLFDKGTVTIPIGNVTIQNDSCESISKTQAILDDSIVIPVKEEFINERGE